MPNLSQIYDAYQLSAGFPLGHYTIQSVTGSEITISRYKEYRYQIELLLTAVNTGEKINVSDVVSSVNSGRLFGRRVLAVRNYYDTYFDPIQNSDVHVDGDKVVVVLTGHATR